MEQTEGLQRQRITDRRTTNKSADKKHKHGKRTKEQAQYYIAKPHKRLIFKHIQIQQYALQTHIHLTINTLQRFAKKDQGSQKTQDSQKKFNFHKKISGFHKTFIQRYEY